MLKIKRFRSKKYLRAVASLPCCVCRAPDSVPHHIMGPDYAGIGTKAPDDLTMPMCHRHHMDLHQDGYRLWEQINISQVDRARETREKLIEILKPEWDKFYMKHQGYIPEMRIEVIE